MGCGVAAQPAAAANPAPLAKISDRLSSMDILPFYLILHAMYWGLS